MKTTKIIAISIFLLLVACGITVWILKERKENLLINPEIYPAFRKIEIYALLYVNQKTVNIAEYNRYKAVADHMGEFYSDESAEEYYIFLKRLGFNLPSFKLKKPPAEEQKNKCMMEEDRLVKLQTKIIEGQITKDLREIEGIIEGATKSQKIE